MKNFNFNEKREIEDMIANGYVDESNYGITIGKLALYNYSVFGLNREDNYDAIKKYMTEHARDFFEAEYQKRIYREISSVKNRILRDIDSVNITEIELNRISQLNDIRKEKMAFVLVATAKYYDAIKKCVDHYTNVSNTEICKLARITMKSSDRNAFMSFIYDEGIVERHSRPHGSGKRVLFVSDSETDNIVLSLKQIDFKELAYQYLNWKDGGGFDRCILCGRLIKHRKNVLYCEECANISEKEHCRIASKKYRDSKKINRHG